MPAQAFTKPSVPPACSPDRALLASLRARIGRIEGTAGVERMREAWPLGVAAIDAVLPGGGLPRGCLHEIVAADAGGAAAAFATVLLARLAGDGGSVVWCRCDSSFATKLYGPGLAVFGLGLRQLLVVRARRDTDVLWAMEEGLRSGAVSAVLGEVIAAPPIALRRLQLAAETGSTTGLLLRPFGVPAASAALATTRWRVASAPSDPLTPPLTRRQKWEDLSPRPSPQRRGNQTACVGKPLPLPLRGSFPLPRAGEGRGEGAHLLLARWRVELLRCRATAPAGWLLDWCHETHRFGVAAELRDRPVAPAATDRSRRAAV